MSVATDTAPCPGAVAFNLPAVLDEIRCNAGQIGYLLNDVADHLMRGGVKDTALATNPDSQSLSDAKELAEAALHSQKNALETLQEILKAVRPIP